MYRVLLIDDEPAATQALKRSLAAFEEIDVIGSYNDPEKGIEAICQQIPNVVFMDIEMPGLDGFMVAKATEHIPYHLVYVTAYSEHALSAFETKVVDYLLKPVRQTRLERCLEKIKALPPLASPSVESEVLVSDGKTTYRLTQSDISYIESIGRYQQVNLTTSGQRKFQLQTIVTEETMTNFENELGAEHFLRVHRSYIVNLSLITQVHREARNTLVSLSNTEQAIPIARAKVALVNSYLVK
ncbi:LytR/AlgR family response regulator transcription factor [Vibrio methylphosphonaticus]|uniref:LytR/AlgR family response regulator transcription factor n=1 Tax=Vibrio methylphosphonaticus TaxID=2946866 RepID=UPI00202A2CD3|nr:LytTR family DNA-binding domain-containing protein [Vibrio methylphosphonaticus]MCL9773805.1 LytTR family DNA-binding domain-containing protein [Vibrio methylphosphonaticus]